MADKTLFTQEILRVESEIPDGMTIGDIRREGNKLFKYVKYDPGADEDLVVGDVLAYKDISNDDVTGDFSDVAATVVAAGIVPVAVDLSVDGASNVAFLWVQIEGPAVVSVAPAGSPADGDLLKLDEAVDKGLTLVLDSANKQRPVAVAIDVSAKTVLADFPH